MTEFIFEKEDIIRKGKYAGDQNCLHIPKQAYKPVFLDCLV